MSNKEIVRNYYKEEYKRELDATDNEFEASDYAIDSTLAYASGRFPRMTVKTFTNIIWEIRDEMWGI